MTHFFNQKFDNVDNIVSSCSPKLYLLRQLSLREKENYSSTQLQLFTEARAPVKSIRHEAQPVHVLSS